MIRSGVQRASGHLCSEGDCASALRHEALLRYHGRPVTTGTFASAGHCLRPDPTGGWVPG